MKPRILVVGDAMADIYYFGTTTRVSPEAPIPVVKVTDSKSFHGGAGNVFTNLVALEAETKLRSGTPTPVKNRLMVGNTQVARWDTNDDVHPIELEELDEAILHWQPDAIVVSDYGKGSVNHEVIDWIFNQGIVTFIDTKKDPKEFVLRYNSTILPRVVYFPNQHEYEQYKESYDLCACVILKRGANGVKHLSWGNIGSGGQFTAKAKQVVSVCGAGDTVIAAYAYAACVGYPDPLQFANIAAAIVVEKPFTATASLQEVEERLGCRMKKV